MNNHLLEPILNAIHLASVDAKNRGEDRKAANLEAGARFIMYARAEYPGVEEKFRKFLEAIEDDEE